MHIEHGPSLVQHILTKPMDKRLHRLLQPQALHPNEPVHHPAVPNEHDRLAIINAPPNLKAIPHKLLPNHPSRSDIGRHHPELHNIRDDSSVFEVSCGTDTEELYHAGDFGVEEAE